MAELHASVEQGDAEAVALLLRGRREADREGEAEQGELREERGGVRRGAREKEEEGGVGGGALGGALPPSIAAAEAENGKGMGGGEGVSLVNCPCPRTGMAPLLKAVEIGSGEVARLLLEAGADVSSKVGG